MHTIEKGDLAVAMLTAKFLRKRFVVLKPISELSRYDLVIERGNGFERVQCKMGRLRDGVIYFNACSNTIDRKGGPRRSYKGEIELFGVYCHEADTCHLVPVDHVGINEGTLRTTVAKNGQKSGVRWANDYLLC